MSEKAIRQEVDRFLELDASIKKQSEELETLKATFKAIAAEQNRREFEGTHGGKVQVQPLTRSTGDPEALQKQCAALGQPGKFYELITVKTGDAKKFLGETMSTGIITEHSDAYGKVVARHPK